MRGGGKGSCIRAGVRGGEKRLAAPGRGGGKKSLSRGGGEWPPAPSPSPPTHMQHGVASGLGYILILKFVVPLCQRCCYIPFSCLRCRFFALWPSLPLPTLSFLDLST